MSGRTAICILIMGPRDLWGVLEPVRRSNQQHERHFNVTIIKYEMIRFETENVEAWYVLVHSAY